jgi:tetratricopeptide (TPR) repeat protein
MVLIAALAVPAAADESDAALSEEASVNFTRGILLLESGRADKALGPLEEAWRASEHSPVVGLRLAEAYYAVRDLGRAELVVDDVLESEPKNVEVLQLKARLCYARRDVRAAVTHLERARDVAPGSFETERMLASLYSELGDRENAVASLRRCIAAEPSIGHLHVLLGDLLVEMDRPDEAAAAYGAALELDPTDRRALESLTNLLQAEGRTAEAIPYLERFAASEGAPDAAWLALADAYLQAGRADDGIAVLESQRKKGPLPTEADILLGRLYYEAGRNRDAIAVFEPMYEDSGGSPELARILGELYLKEDDPRRARGFLEAAVQKEPDDYRGYLTLFFAQSEAFTQGGPRIEMSAEDAGRLLTKASSLAPRDDFDANYAVGMAFSSADSLESARIHLSRANTIRAGDRGALFNLAAVEEKSGDLESALGHLKELYEIAPDDAAVSNFYGYVLAVMKRDLDRAEKLIRAALAQDPENGYYVDSLGWVYYQRGEYREAVNELERALRIVGEDPVILEHLGDAYAALSRYKDALTAYRQSDRLQEDNLKLREKIQSTERRLQ